MHKSNTITDALADAIEQLKKTSSSPALDGEVLLSFVVAKDRAWLYTHSNNELTKEEINHYETLISKRGMGIPVAHLTGTKEFYGRSFIVTKDVLIPRPATEELVATALQSIKVDPPDQIVDIGTGSGCIAVTLACETSDIPIIAVDVSPKALAIAQKNADRHGVTKRIQFVEGNLFTSEILRLAQDDRRKILVVANLPYLPTHTITKELLHESQLALDGGSDGHELYRKLDQQLQEFSTQNDVAITLISERLAYLNDTSVPSFTISTHTFPGANAISSPPSV
ncbi:MAG: peptide chain release factor N(5)-glutamine methyltransferase [bacterium]|nr:peptide chain release factor N(5)-glutamine methyltransferase [bacterium]